MPAHFRALRRLGPCPIHRRSFGVVREVMGLPPLPPWPVRSGSQGRVHAGVQAGLEDGVDTIVVAAIESGRADAE